MNRESSRITVSFTVGGSDRSTAASRSRTPSITDTVFSPMARRTSSMHRGRLPHPHRRGRTLEAVLRVADVGDADRRPVLGRDHDVVEVRGRVDPAERAQQQLALTLLDGAAGNLDVLRDDGVADLGHRQAVRVQLLDVDDDVDLAGAAAGQADLADAVDGLDGAGDLLVGELGERPQAHAR